MKQYIHELNIGNINLKNNLILAPMAGITDLPFRLMCEKFNPGLVCTEMVSSKALYYGDEKTKTLLNTQNERGPISMQIFGSDVESMVKATEYLNDFADIIDINMGCPAPKVVKNGDGSKLLLNLELAQNIVSEVVKVSKHPVTVKFRKGWNEENIVAVEAAKAFERAGASAITLHGRTRSEFYSGKSDLDIIRDVKKSVSIPVIGNGDVIDGKTALEMFEYTGVDGIMIGRGSIGKPYIFEEIKEYLNGNEYILTRKEILDIMLEHISLEVLIKGEKVGIREMRKHLSAYIKGMSNSAEARQNINKIETKDELERFLKEYFIEQDHK